MSTVILALIPNGLVLSIALTYALGAVRLLGKDMLVQQFNAVESLSNVDVLCTDKTGTLTSGVVKFEETGAAGRRRRARSAPARRLRGQHHRRQPDDRGAAHRYFRTQRVPAAHEAFFSSDRKWSGLAFAAGEARGTYVLGAPEMLAPALRAGADWRAQADAWAARGLRVVLFAGRAEPLAFGEPDGPPGLPETSRPSALICFSDELRPGVRETLEEFSERRHRRQDHLRRQPQDGDRPRHAGRRADAAPPRGRRRVLRLATSDAATAATTESAAAARTGCRAPGSRRLRVRPGARGHLTGGVRRDGRRRQTSSAA